MIIRINASHGLIEFECADYTMKTQYSATGLKVNPHLKLIHKRRVLL